MKYCFLFYIDLSINVEENRRVKREDDVLLSREGGGLVRAMSSIESFEDEHIAFSTQSRTARSTSKNFDGLFLHSHGLLLNGFKNDSTLSSFGSHETPSSVDCLSSPNSSSLKSDYQDDKVSRFTISSPPKEKRMRRKICPPNRSISPTNQAAGVLFRMSQTPVNRSHLGRSVNSRKNELGVEFGLEVLRGGLSRSIKAATGIVIALDGKPLPPATLDYGFAYASRSLEEGCNSSFYEISRRGSLDSGVYEAAEMMSQNYNKGDRFSEGSTRYGRGTRKRRYVSRSYNPNSFGSPPDSSDELSNVDRPDNLLEKSREIPKQRGSGRGRKSSHPPAPRVCISCGATKTPYWREAWANSVLLCNACGLRYSKFRRRCVDCSYVPRKEDKGSRACSKCNGAWS